MKDVFELECVYLILLRLLHILQPHISQHLLNNRRVVCSQAELENSELQISFHHQHVLLDLKNAETEEIFIIQLSPKIYL